MIPKLFVARHARLGAATWPVWEGRHSTPLFLGRQPFRKLVVLLDHDLVAGLESSNWTQEWLLAGLLTLDLCECVRYSDDGPPPDATKYGDDVFGEWVIGWAVVGAEDHGGIMGHRPVRWSADDQSVTDSGIIGNHTFVARRPTPD